jgi:hypothetical protein
MALHRIRETGTGPNFDLQRPANSRCDAAKFAQAE